MPALSTLTDDFSSGISADRWIIGNGEVLESGGVTFAGYGSVLVSAANDLDVTGSSLTFQMRRYLRGTGSPNVFTVRLWNTSTVDTFDTWFMDHGDGTTLTADGVTFTPVLGEYWRIREQSGSIYLERSADGTSGWAIITTRATPSFLTSCRLTFYVENTVSETVMPLIDNINTVGAPPVVIGPKSVMWI